MSRSAVLLVAVFFCAAVAAVGVYFVFGLGWSMISGGITFALMLISLVDADGKGEKQ